MALPSATTEVAKSWMIGGSPGRGTPAQNGEVLPAALDRAERRDDQAPAHVHHVDGRAVRLRRALRPVPDASQVARVPERGDRHPMPACLLDPEVHGLLADRLSEPVAAVDDRDHLGLALDPDALPRHDLAGLHPLQVAAGAEHAVRVVPAQVGAGEPPRDAPGLHGVAAGTLEDRSDEALHGRCVDVDLPARAADRRAPTHHRVPAHPRASAMALAQAAL